MYDTDRTPMEQRRRDALWRPTKKQAFVGLGALLLIGVAIATKDPSILGGSETLLVGRGSDEPSRAAPQPRERSFWWRLLPWFAPSKDTLEYEDVVVYPDQARKG